MAVAIMHGFGGVHGPVVVAVVLKVVEDIEVVMDDVVRVVVVSAVVRVVVVGSVTVVVGVVVVVTPTVKIAVAESLGPALVWAHTV